MAVSYTHLDVYKRQGTFLGAAYELYKITGEESYLKDARKAANFAISNSSMIAVSYTHLDYYCGAAKQCHGERFR